MNPLEFVTSRPFPFIHLLRRHPIYCPRCIMRFAAFVAYMVFLLLFLSLSLSLRKRGENPGPRWKENGEKREEGRRRLSWELMDVGDSLYRLISSVPRDFSRGGTSEIFRKGVWLDSNDFGERYFENKNENWKSKILRKSSGL